ncbi:MAG: YdeI/OmpD-associated family protein [Dehalococcoidia bacterium]
MTAAAPAAAGKQRFTARIYKLAMNYCVDVPAEVSRALPSVGHSGHHVAVAVTAGGHTARTRLVPRGGGGRRLFLNSALRAAAGAGEGDDVTVTLALDAGAREPPVPDDLRAALDDVDGAAEAFAGLTFVQRTGMLRWLGEARRPETRAQRIERLTVEMHDRARK